MHIVNQTEAKLQLLPKIWIVKNRINFKYGRRFFLIWKTEVNFVYVSCFLCKTYPSFFMHNFTHTHVCWEEGNDLISSEKQPSTFTLNLKLDQLIVLDETIIDYIFLLVLNVFDMWLLQHFVWPSSWIHKST